MSTATRVPLAQAVPVANELMRALSPGCDRIAVAGSLRRRVADVGDIELVAVPRMRVETVPGLLEDEQREVDDLGLLVDRLLVRGTLAKHPTDPKRGPRYSKLLHTASGLQLDLFETTLASWGLTLLIRTGPAAYSQWLVTEGHHVAGGELHVGRLGCASWSPCEVMPTPEEADVYAALGLAVARPEDRR